MKKLELGLAITTLSCSMLLFSTAWNIAKSPCDRPLKVAFDHQPPFLIVNDGELIGGLDKEILDELSQRIHCQLEWISVSWQQHLQQLETGQIDIASQAYRQPVPKSFTHISAPYRVSDSVLFTLKQSMHQPAPSLITNKHYRVGMVQHPQVELSKPLDKAIKPAQVSYVMTSVDNLQQLTQHRVDGIIEERFMMAELAKQYRVENQVMDTNQIAHTEPVHLMFSKASVPTDVVQGFNQAIKDLQRNKTLHLIEQRYRLPSLH